MLEPVATAKGARLDYLGTIPAAEAPMGPVEGVLDTVDIWLAATLQSLFNLIKR